MAEGESKGYWEFKWQSLWEKYKVPIGLGLFGIILIGIGTLTILTITSKEPEIEIIPLENQETLQSVFIDLEGAVEKPGLYELPVEARLNDLLIRAGGLSVEADRDWVEKNLNLAQKLSDGVKIYIPREGEVAEDQAIEGIASASQINLNTASAAQLDTLWGIGQSRAKDIIDHRPYASVDELIDRKIVPVNVFERIKEEVTVF